MLRMMIVISLSILTTCAVAASGTEELIDTSLKKAAELRTAGKLDDSLAVLDATANVLIALLPVESDAGETLASAIAEAKGFSEVSRRQNRLFWGLQETRAAIDFKPVIEAPLPAGFPGPGEVGKIVVKEYPAYRAARTSMSDVAGENSAFGKLFRHISANDVKMTAPVEMVYKGDDAPVSMAFLYERPDLGTSRKDGPVEVVDLPAVTVVSVGVRGNYSDDKRQAAVVKLKAWVEANKEYRIVGPVRVMGYNSPFVIPILRFSEVQIPIQKQ